MSSTRSTRKAKTAAGAFFKQIINGGLTEVPGKWLELQKVKSTKGTDDLIKAAKPIRKNIPKIAKEDEKVLSKQKKRRPTILKRSMSDEAGAISIKSPLKVDEKATSSSKSQLNSSERIKCKGSVVFLKKCDNILTKSMFRTSDTDGAAPKLTRTASDGVLSAALLKKGKNITSTVAKPCSTSKLVKKNLVPIENNLDIHSLAEESSKGDSLFCQSRDTTPCSSSASSPSQSPLTHVNKKISPPSSTCASPVSLLAANDSFCEHGLAHEEWGFPVHSHPSEFINKENFLGLVNLATLDSLRFLQSPTRNSLHRHFGGKLRRNIRPRVKPEMVYKEVTMSKSQGFKKLLLSDNEARADFPGSAELSLTSSRSDNTSLEASHDAIGRRLKFDSRVSVDGYTILKPRLWVKKLKSSSPSLISPVPSPVSSLSDNVKSKSGLTKINKMSPVSRPNKEADVLDPRFAPTRRSVRQTGTSRKDWAHLLKAAPDEYFQDGDSSLRSKSCTNSSTRQSKGLVKSPCKSPVKAPNHKIPKSPGASTDTLKKHLTMTEVLKATSPHRPVAVKRKAESMRPSMPEKRASTRPLILKSRRRTQPPTESPTVEDASSSIFVNTGDVFDDAQLTSDQIKGLGFQLSDSHSVPEIYTVSHTQQKEGNPVPKKLQGEQGMYSLGKYDCIVPHMCQACWINDHLYCKNKRKFQGNSDYQGGCLHCIPCEHFMPEQPLSPESMLEAKRLSIGNESFHVLSWNPEEMDDSSKPIVIQPNSSSPKSSLDLCCAESLTDSDDDESANPITPVGTEMLNYQLKARAAQIARSLGMFDVLGAIRVAKTWKPYQVNRNTKGKPKREKVIYFDHGAEVVVGNVQTEDEQTMEIMQHAADMAKQIYQQDLKTKKRVKDLLEEKDISSAAAAMAIKSISEQKIYNLKKTFKDGAKAKLREGIVRVRTVAPEQIFRVQLPDKQPASLRGISRSNADGSVELVFTTKELREGNADLLRTLQEAGLLQSIVQQLETDKSSLLSMSRVSENSQRESEVCLSHCKEILSKVVSSSGDLASLKVGLKDLVLKNQKLTNSLANQAEGRSAEFQMLRKLKEAALRRRLFLESLNKAENVSSTFPAKSSIGVAT